AIARSSARRASSLPSNPTRILLTCTLLLLPISAGFWQACDVAGKRGDRYDKPAAPRRRRTDAATPRWAFHVRDDRRGARDDGSAATRTLVHFVGGPWDAMHSHY